MSSDSSPQQLDHPQSRRLERTFPITVLAHNLEGSINVGALFRLADALGIEQIVLSGRSMTPPNRKLRKVSRRTEKWVPYRYQQNPLTVLSELKEKGYLIAALEITSDSLDIREFASAADEKICLVLGSENAGISLELLKACDVCLHIPMFGRNSSMNVATACAIAVYELAKPLMPAPSSD